MKAGWIELETKDKLLVSCFVLDLEGYERRYARKLKDINGLDCLAIIYMDAERGAYRYAEGGTFDRYLFGSHMSLEKMKSETELAIKHQKNKLVEAL